MQVEPSSSRAASELDGNSSSDDDDNKDNSASSNKKQKITHDESKLKDLIVRSYFGSSPESLCTALIKTPGLHTLDSVEFGAVELFYNRYFSIQQLCTPFVRMACQYLGGGVHGNGDVSNQDFIFQFFGKIKLFLTEKLFTHDSTLCKEFYHVILDSMSWVASNDDAFTHLSEFVSLIPKECILSHTQDSNRATSAVAAIFPHHTDSFLKWKWVLRAILALEKDAQDKTGLILSRVVHGMLLKVLPTGLTRNWDFKSKFHFQVTPLQYSASTTYTGFCEEMQKVFPEQCRWTAEPHFGVLDELVKLVTTHMETHSGLTNKVFVTSNLMLKNHLKSQGVASVLSFYGANMMSPTLFMYYMICMQHLSPERFKEWLKTNATFVNLVFLSELLYSDGGNKTCVGLQQLQWREAGVEFWDGISIVALRVNDPFRAQQPSNCGDDDCEPENLVLEYLSAESFLQESIQRLLEFGTKFKKCFTLEVSFADELGRGQGVLYSWFNRIVSKLLEPELGLFYLEKETNIYNVGKLENLNYSLLQCSKEELFEFLGLFFGLLFHYKVAVGVQFSSYFLNKFVDFYPRFVTVVAEQKPVTVDDNNEDNRDSKNTTTNQNQTESKDATTTTATPKKSNTNNHSNTNDHNSNHNSSPADVPTSRIALGMELDPEYTMNLLKLRDTWEMCSEMFPDCHNAVEAITRQFDSRFHFISDDATDALLRKKFCYLASNLKSGYVLPSVLQSTLCGCVQKLEISDWKKHIRFGDQVPNKMRDFLWQWLIECTSEQHSQFIQFVTCRRALTDKSLSSLEPKFTVLATGTGSSSDPQSQNQQQSLLLLLPTARTCLHEITFPAYSTYELFKTKLELTLSVSTTEFFGFG